MNTLRAFISDDKGMATLEFVIWVPFYVILLVAVAALHAHSRAVGQPQFERVQAAQGARSPAQMDHAVRRQQQLGTRGEVDLHALALRPHQNPARGDVLAGPQQVRRTNWFAEPAVAETQCVQRDPALLQDSADDDRARPLWPGPGLSLGQEKG